MASKISQVGAGEAYNHWMEQTAKYYSGNLDVFSTVYRGIIAHIYGIKDKDKPIGKILLVGPSGSGKSYIPEVVARVIHSDKSKLLHIDASEYASDHEVAKLLGSPPGYLGHKETEPVFSEKTIKEHTGVDLDVCIARVDEIDKAGAKFHNSFLGPIEYGYCNNGLNKRVNFNNVFFIFTANAGEGSVYNSKNISFVKDTSNKKKTVRQLLTKSFPTAFLNRMDSSILISAYSKKEIHNAIKMQVDMYISELGTYSKFLEIDDSFYDEFSCIPYDKNFGLRDMIRDAKSIVKEAAVDAVLYNKKHKYVIDREDVKSHMEHKNVILGSTE